jgi:hypothetical protein
MFPLTKKEFLDLKSQIATSSSGWGGRRKPPLDDNPTHRRKNV